ncbi:glycosyltransferase [Flavobacterium soyae]|uniref:Glycosyltransferase n=1 Tax=Flavobacterium soyae TaxID=2903098 RepID=A0ABZ2UF62_9FLAO|nr:glycosyltransferase [Flavobacterium soyae]MCD9575267.1 glycosyltransferase family protein [Flavobacterium soyae]
MISIIICSRSTQIDPIFFNNITETVDSAYELIIIDNSENKHSIFEAYNLGIKKSKGTYLCFIHDDIRFHTKGWGKAVISIFQSDAEIGLIGIAGTKVKGKMISGWWDCPEEYRVMNIMQHLNSGKTEHWNMGWRDNSVEEVVAVDGVFMAMPKKEKISFSEKFKGFHNYDLDISFKVKKCGKKIVVTNQILLEHFSEGQVDANWVKSTLKIHNYYNKILPLTVENNLSKDELESIDFENLKKMIYLAFTYKRPYLAFRIWFKFFLKHPKNKFHNYFLREFIKLI